MTHSPAVAALVKITLMSRALAHHFGDDIDAGAAEDIFNALAERGLSVEIDEASGDDSRAFTEDLRAIMTEHYADPTDPYSEDNTVDLLDAMSDVGLVIRRQEPSKAW